MIDKIIKNKFFVFFLFSLLAVILTWPLIIKLNAFYPFAYGSDAEFFIWDIWHFKHLVFDLKQNPFGCLDTVFYPIGFNNAATGYENLINKIPALIFWPIFKNPLIIYNLLIILNLAFASWTTFLLVLYLTKNKKIAFLCGIIFGFSPYMLARSLGHLNLLTTGWIPLFVLYFLKLWQAKKIKDAVLAALFFLCVSLSSWYYSIFILLFIFIFLLYYFLTTRKSLLNFILSKPFLIFVLLAIFLTGLVVSPFLKTIIQKEALPPAKISPSLYSAFILSYILPLPLSLIGKWVPREEFISLSENYLESTTFLGFLEIILLLYFLKNYHRHKLNKASIWLFVGLIFFVFSLGPFLKPSQIILPYSFLSHLPIFSFLRAVSRYSLMVMLSLTIICAYSLNIVFQKTNSKRKNLIFGSLIFLFLLERAIFPAPLKKADVHHFYQEIRQDQEDYAILETPFNSFLDRHDFNFYQAIHQKKIVFGSLQDPVTRNPKTYQFIDSNIFIKSLFCYSQAPNIESLPNSNELLKILAQTKIRYIIIHKNKLKSCPKVESWLPNYLNILKPYFEDNLIKAYKTF